jgi:hypothetical protein
MPRQSTPYEPDAIDCNSMEGSLANDFGLCARVQTIYNADEVVVICRCCKVAVAPDGPIIVQAMARRPLRACRNLFAMHYSVLLDCWHQCDRGVLGAAARPIERGWDGRPKQPRPRT